MKGRKHSSYWALKIATVTVEFATIRPMGTCREGLALLAQCWTIGVIGLITRCNYPELIEINRLIITAALCSLFLYLLHVVDVQLFRNVLSWLSVFTKRPLSNSLKLIYIRGMIHEAIDIQILYRNLVFHLPIFTEILIHWYRNKNKLVHCNT